MHSDEKGNGFTHGVSENGHEMIQDSRNLSKEGTDPLGAIGDLCGQRAG